MSLINEYSDITSMMKAYDVGAWVGLGMWGVFDGQRLVFFFFFFFLGGGG